MGQSSDNIKVNAKTFCKVLSMNDNNVHITIDDQYDGIISLSELSWLKKPRIHQIININEEIEVLVLDIDNEEENKL